MDNEPRTAEGRLIQAAADRAALSARRVAAMIGISDTQYRHWVRGYDGRGGAVTFPAPGLVKAARALNVTPAQLREVDREDAADLMEQATVVPGLDPNDPARRLTETVRPEDQDAGVLLSLPPGAFDGLTPADREEAIAAAKAALLERAREIKRRIDP